MTWLLYIFLLLLFILYIEDKWPLHLASLHKCSSFPSQTLHYSLIMKLYYVLTTTQFDVLYIYRWHQYSNNLSRGLYIDIIYLFFTSLLHSVKNRITIELITL